jgi:hypothetical protein
MIIKAAKKYRLEIVELPNNAITYREQGREEWSTFHYPTQAQYAIGVRNLCKTGYASLPRRKGLASV